MTRDVWFIATEPDSSKFVGAGFFRKDGIGSRHSAGMNGRTGRRYRVFSAVVTVTDGEEVDAHDPEQIKLILERLFKAAEFFSARAIDAGEPMPIDEVRKHYESMAEAERMLMQ